MDVPSGKQSDRSGSTPGLLTRLRRDSRGNTLAIVGAALIPLTAMIGSGVDMSRAYMAKTRLQSACDAASLAGRRVMTNDTLDATVTTEAIKFFNFNFPQGLYQTAAFTPTVSRPSQGTVEVVANTTIPTTIMSMFGFKTLPLAVDCQASQNFVNTDILLVLDTTGSMACDVNGFNCSGGSTSKIVGLREAVLALYDELKPIQDKLEAGGMRLRYGIVPYASGVNVGKLVYAANPNYMINDNYTYDTRVGIYRNPKSATGVTLSWCTGQDNDSWTKTSGSGSSAIGKCTYTVDEEDTPSSGGTFLRWSYKKNAWDVSDYVKGNSVLTPTRSQGSSSKSKWAGCIEERGTVTSITSASGYSIPAGANDLNTNLVPDGTTAKKWAPFWPEVEYLATNKYQYGGENNKPQWACPTESRRLQAWSRSDLSDYLDLLQPDGGTYHDNGMIWGARLISNAGIFADSPDTYKDMPVAKHIIFMTDGLLDTGFDTLYTTYGVEGLDGRIGASDQSDQLTRHRQRFKMMCNAVKGMNVSIWVVAFAATPDSTLTECASSASQVSTSSNKAELIAKFTEIGKNIGALRLTQ
jgi:Flp pilus assembly protein TadG